MSVSLFAMSMMSVKDKMANITLFGTPGADNMVSLLDIIVTIIVFFMPILIEAYVVHRMLAISFRMAIPRMLVTNIVALPVQFLVAHFVLERSFILIAEWLNHVTRYQVFVFNILATVILFLIHVFVTCRVYYHVFERSVNIMRLRKTIFMATALSHVFMYLFFMVF